MGTSFMMQCMEAPTVLYLICTASVRKDLRSSSHCFDQHPPLIRLFNIRISRTSAHGLQLPDLVITNSPETVLLLWETTVRKAHYCRETKNVTFPMKYTQVYPEEIQRRKWQMGCAGWLKCHLVQNDINDDDFGGCFGGGKEAEKWPDLNPTDPTEANIKWWLLSCPHLAPQVLPIVIFFSTVMSMLYYLGLMQWIIRKVLGLAEVGWQVYSSDFRDKVLNAFYPGFLEQPYCLYQDLPPPPLPSQVIRPESKKSYMGP